MNRDPKEYELRLLIARVAEDPSAPEGLLFWLRHNHHKSIAAMWRGTGFNDTDRNLSHWPGIPRPDWMLYLLRLCKSSKADEVAPLVTTALRAEATGERHGRQNWFPLLHAVEAILERVPASSLALV